MVLEEIVKMDTVESINMEAKVRLDRTDVVGWLKTIAGFSNAQGGIMYVGVEDKTNKLVGLEKKDIDSERNYFSNQVNEHIVPCPPMKITFLPYENNGRELYIMKIEVGQSPAKPVVLKYKEIPSIYMRREGFTNGATLEEITAMAISSKKSQYDILDSDIDYHRDDFKKLLAFFSEYNDGKVLTDKALASIGFFNEKKKLKNGAVLFMDQYDGDKTSVQCSAYSGFTKGSNRIITINKFKGNLIDSIQFMLEFVEQRMNHSIVKKDFGRENLDAYPNRALFEAIINAIAHRDYYIDGSQIQIDMFKDRLEISSPGSFYQGAQIEKTYDLTKYISKRRNELISGILVLCNVMEAAGTGFDKIVKAYDGVDVFHKPFIYSTSDHFTLTLPDLTNEEGVNSSTELPSIDFVPLAKCSEYDEKVLTYCYYCARKASEIATFIGVKDSNYSRKKIIGTLVEKGYLNEVSGKSPKLYRTNPDIVLSPGA